MTRVPFTRMIFLITMVLALAGLRVDVAPGEGPPSFSPYTGSLSCRKCHEKFYQLWAPSHHGLAMQPFTLELARNKLSRQTEEIVVGDFAYLSDIGAESFWVIERGPDSKTRYRIDYAMGGKNVYYFLTTLDRGRLQTLPIAYDLNKKEWFDMAASGVRHFQSQTDEPISWKDWQYTFNTSCYGCHVSQISTNYDPRTDRYDTVWKEPGINCETCHGPADEHVRVCEAAPKGIVPKDLKIRRGGRDFTADQNNATCSSCHAKAVIITDTFEPGARFFDYFGLVTLENSDYYPDGRDLGENYTYTSWLMSPCVKSGKLDCLHCHTSSGRYKFQPQDRANQACLPCHKEKVYKATEHSHHKEDSAGNKCISCHMPMTEFARMRRTDHSMVPPAPASTIAFKSPNACNICHKDKTPQWADEFVRRWRQRDYQAPLLQRASLIEDARTGNWNRLQEMLDYITNKDRDEIFATSLIRLIPVSTDKRVASTLVTAMKDPSPLVRSAAATALQGIPTQESVLELVKATGDDYRLVRVRAAASLSGYRNLSLQDDDRKKVESANKEYLDSVLSRPDQWESHYNLGNYYLNQNDYKRAVSLYEKALEFEPRGVLSMVNQSIAFARLGENVRAKDALQRALSIAPNNAAANFNMGLLMAEENDPIGAEKHLGLALQADPQMDQAAYNLCVILSKGRLDDAISFCRKASEIRPDVIRYTFTLAFYQQQKGNFPEATRLLENLIRDHPLYSDAYSLLGGIYETQKMTSDARRIYNRGLATSGIPDKYKIRFRTRLDSLNRSNETKKD